MKPANDLHPVLFIDNYFPVVDGVTETVHEYARHMDHAAVVCPAMERHYLEKYSFDYRLLTSATVRIPLSRYATAMPKINRKLEKEIAGERPDIFRSIVRFASNKQNLFLPLKRMRN